jgi:hypothetical protein
LGDLRAGLDDLEKRKFLAPPGFELRPLVVVQPVASSYTDYAIQAPIYKEFVLQFGIDDVVGGRFLQLAPLLFGALRISFV